MIKREWRNKDREIRIEREERQQDIGKGDQNRKRMMNEGQFKQVYIERGRQRETGERRRTDEDIDKLQIDDVAHILYVYLVMFS